MPPPSRRPSVRRCKREQIFDSVLNDGDVPRLQRGRIEVEYELCAPVGGRPIHEADRSPRVGEEANSIVLDLDIEHDQLGSPFEREVSTLNGDLTVRIDVDAGIVTEMKAWRLQIGLDDAKLLSWEARSLQNQNRARADDTALGPRVINLDEGRAVPRRQGIANRVRRRGTARQGRCYGEQQTPHEERHTATHPETPSPPEGQRPAQGPIGRRTS